ncbi:TMEM175 family protein [Flavisolibacter tropicus]|uniref:Integral membrane protein n=1 Tax=Flavisolibacter tropicus TaxID=1492898 RepID=A0A172TXH5_9BACT|nr:TMEM175 family protein [Flavisolibacter tropicus]ANE51740.1 hypothetical protein SY85_15795 [Flavisolibacter tropicus]
MTKTRLEAFSDGVIAILITIMVLELKTPHGTSWEAIKPLLPVLVSYILSFIMLGIYWGNHHHLLHTITHINSRIIWANQHLLFWLSLIPFATAWMGENNFSPITVAAYALLLDLCGGAYFILLRLVEKTHSPATRLHEPLKKQERKGLISVLTYTLAIPTAFIHPLISGALFLLVAAIWWIPDSNIERTIRREEEIMSNQK